MTDPQQKETPEDIPAESGAPTLDESLRQIAELSKKLLETETRLAEANDKTLRALAEAENTRRRAERERQDTAKFSVASFAKDILTVADNLRRALAAIPPDARKNEQMNSIYTGVEATERELLRAFESNGIKKIEAMNQKFDPNLHEVLFEAPTAGKAAGTVIQVIDAGYTIHERLLRPARVGIAKGDDASPQSGSRLDEQA